MGFLQKASDESDCQHPNRDEAQERRIYSSCFETMCMCKNK